MGSDATGSRAAKGGMRYPDPGTQPHDFPDDTDATPDRAAKGNLVSRIDAQLPKRLTPEADLYVGAADGDPPATPDRTPSANLPNVVPSP